MADDDAPLEERTQPDLEIDIQFVDSLPGGRAVMPLERKGKFVWLAVRGHVSPQARDEMTADLTHILRSGLWQQNWQPPRPER